MGKNSKIEWTHHTFNPWWGCVKVSAACKHCYAETWARRVGQDVWGARAPRRFFSEQHWRQPLQWDAQARTEGERRRVFCASMADVFEGRADLDATRERLWGLIESTPHLDWLLLTKRPERVRELAPWSLDWPPNIWLGTTVESARWLKRVDALAENAAAVRFLSCEPLLGPLSLGPRLASVDWVIAGGESGGKARPMSPTWVRALRDECVAAGVAFHFKQWGNWRPADQHGVNGYPHRTLGAGGSAVEVVHVGKKVAGRELDGRTWDELPSPREERRTGRDRPTPDRSLRGA